MLTYGAASAAAACRGLDKLAAGGVRLVGGMAGSVGYVQLMRSFSLKPIWVRDLHMLDLAERKDLVRRLQTPYPQAAAEEIQHWLGAAADYVLRIGAQPAEEILRLAGAVISPEGGLSRSVALAPFIMSNVLRQYSPPAGQAMSERYPLPVVSDAMRVGGWMLRRHIAALMRKLIAENHRCPMDLPTVPQPNPRSRVGSEIV
ncbi:MAG: hypothetical protein MO853_02265 [Candidatus Protistobacter heckmanni]|nr:hypothetical protein [Candidatus Protistobacter heckmanni]